LTNKIELTISLFFSKKIGAIIGLWTTSSLFIGEAVEIKIQDIFAKFVQKRFRGCIKKAELKMEFMIFINENYGVTTKQVNIEALIVNYMNKVYPYNGRRWLGVELIY